jgi:FkbM family methyltransferase
MSLFKGISRNLRDGATLGLTFPLRHISGLLGRKYHVSLVRGAGVVTIRPKSSDAQTIIDVFGSKVYDLSRWHHFSYVTATYRTILATGHVPVIIDAGANIGAGSIWFSRQFPLATIIAVEPDPENADVCRLNTHGLPNVSVVEAAIGSTKGFVSLSNPTNQGWTVQTTRSDAGRVPVRTVSDLMADVGSSARLFITKIDIEGFEDDLFSQNVEWVNDVQVIIVEPHDWLFPGKRTSQNLHKAVSGRNFETLISGENLVFVRVSESD